MNSSAPNPLGMSMLISHPQAPSVTEQLRLFAGVGFDSFFLSSGTVDDFEPIPDWAEAARRCGIFFEAVHAPTQYVDGVWRGGMERDIYQKLLWRIIELCAAGGVPKAVLHTAADPGVPVTPEGIAFWRKTEEFATRHGVCLCYENSAVPVHFAAVVQDLAPGHGICHDVGHQFCYTPQHAFEKQYADKILYTHLHDNRGSMPPAGGTDLHLLPFDGLLDWQAYARALACAGYRGTLNLELSCFHSKAYCAMSFSDFAALAFERVLRLRELKQEAESAPAY